MKVWHADDSKLSWLTDDGGFYELRHYWDWRDHDAIRVWHWSEDTGWSGRDIPKNWILA